MVVSCFVNPALVLDACSEARGERLCVALRLWLFDSGLSGYRIRCLCGWRVTAVAAIWVLLCFLICRATSKDHPRFAGQLCGLLFSFCLC